MSYPGGDPGPQLPPRRAGLPPPRLDQVFNPPQSPVPPGTSAGTVRARFVIISGPVGGLFVYSPAPGPGNLVASITAGSGIDPYGNAYQATVSVYNTAVSLFMSLVGGGLSFGKTSDFAPAALTTISDGIIQLSSPLKTSTDIGTFLNMFSAAASGLGVTDPTPPAQPMPVTPLSVMQGVLNLATLVGSSNGVAFVPPTGDHTGSADVDNLQQFWNQGVHVIYTQGTYYWGDTANPLAPSPATGNRLWGGGRSFTRVIMSEPINMGFSTQQNEIEIGYLRLDGVPNGCHLFTDCNFGRFELHDCELDVDGNHCWWYAPQVLTSGNFIMFRSRRNSWHYQTPSGGRLVPPFYVQTPTGCQITQSSFDGDDWFNDQNDSAVPIIWFQNLSTAGSTTATCEWRNQTVEHPYGGWLMLQSATGCRLSNVVMWDLPAKQIANSIITIAKDQNGLNPNGSSDILIEGYSRRGGTLAAGIADIEISNANQVTIDTPGSDVGGSALTVQVFPGLFDIHLHGMPETSVIVGTAGTPWRSMNTRGYQNGWADPGVPSYPRGAYRVTDDNRTELVGGIVAGPTAAPNQVIINLPTTYQPLSVMPVPCMLPVGAYLLLGPNGNLIVGAGIAPGNTVVFSCLVPLDP